MAATAKAEKRRRSSKRPAEAASGSADSPAASTRSKKRRGKQPAEDPSPVVPARLAEDGPSASAEEGSPPIEEVKAEEEQQVEVRQLSPKKRASRPNRPNRDEGEKSRLVGSPIPMNEARRRWPDRYKAQANAPGSAQSSDEEEILHVKRHYRRAIVDGVTYSLYDNAYVKTNGTTTLLTLQDFNMASLIPLASGSQDVVAGMDAGVADAVQLVGVSDSVAVDQAAFVFCDGGLSCELVEIIFDVNGIVDGVAVGMSLLSSLPLADDGVADYIGRIVEFFETINGKLYFTAQWFYRAEDTVMKNHTFCHATKVEHDPRRVFLSEDKNNNPLDCIVSKIQIVRLAPNIDLTAKKDSIPPCDLYYDMSYSMSYSTFANLPPENGTTESESSSTICSEGHPISTNRKAMSDSEESSSGEKNIVTLLDLYSGCGAMSTGLCLGANLSGINLQTSWAVDLNPFACQSLQLNHPGTEVRNENAEHFLRLLKEWVILCGKYDALGNQNFLENESNSTISDEESGDSELERDEFEVEKLLDICYGDPSDTGDVGLKFKVRWKGYDSSYDTWEPLDGLSNCEERIVDFVRQGYRKNILPLPGRVDVICGGPPCQGISGFNRFRNKDAPLEDPKNKQMLIFMDIVEFLKPKYVLMENVVDILKFAQGFLGRYALSRLVAMNYQARLGIMAAGSYGLPQFRMRVFLWGALPTEVLPQFPLPTHDVKVRGGAPNEFEQNMVAYNENESPDLSRALFLEDAISDLPSVTNYEIRDEMKNDKPPRTEFQHSIRLSRNGTPMERHQLFDHRPLQLNEDDYQRVCQIPKRKGANFRDLPGVLVGPDNKVEWDPNVERILLPSGKPLVPDYAMSFIRGKSPKPFGRLWWDETVPTVVTRAEPHNQIILHPEQDRVLTIRENARLQGFPDYYQLVGPVKERYIQVGNAVAMPVSRALGYAFGRAYHGQFHSNPVLVLPADYPVAAEPAESAD